MKKTIICSTLLFCAIITSIYSQQTESENPFLSGFQNVVPEYRGQDLFPIFSLYSGGVCEQYAGACSALIEDFVSFDKNPAASSIIYSGPFIGFAHRNYLISDSVESIGLVHSIGRFGFGGYFRYMQSILNNYQDGVVSNIFSPNELAFGLNMSYNFLRIGIVDGISLGTNLKSALVLFPEARNQGAERQENIAINRSAILIDFGSLINLHAFKIIEMDRPNLSFGLTYRNFGANILLNGQSSLSTGKLTFGVAYLPIPYISFSSDIGLAITDMTQISVNQLMDFSFGLGIIPVDFIELGMGFYIDSSQYFFTAGASVVFRGIQIRFTKRIDAFSSLTSFNNFTINISLKVQNTISENRKQSVQKIYLQALQALLAEDLEQAASLANQALVISPRYTPAREIQKQVRALQKVRQFF